MDIDFPNAFTPAANAIRAGWNDDIWEAGDTIDVGSALGVLSQRIVDVLAYAAQFEILSRIDSGFLRVETDAAGKRFVVDPRLPGSEQLPID